MNKIQNMKHSALVYISIVWKVEKASEQEQDQKSTWMRYNGQLYDFNNF